ncbi:hypothetical protein Cgig2_014939 [Carnegiea gigantea]|uniref:NAC domain-containing protein n=1 Tax=Carnegiea gigantea TaxID=171969 RepID=A0A9Q1Q7W6_9CARY|nr:hypothetical protein Cgig2_014939 [Carnegiea gigantea]
MDQIESCVPPGFRFHPTEEELVGFYLKRKVDSLKFDLDVITDIDLYRMEPWDIQEKCGLGYEEQNEWYFFSHKDRKYPTGTRTNRATAAGFWKATGRDKAVLSKDRIIGMRKTLVFYKGRAPNGRKTDWIMHEYRLQTSEHGPPQEEGWVVCRAFKKPSPSHRQGFGPWSHDQSNYYYGCMRHNNIPTDNTLTIQCTNAFHPQDPRQSSAYFEQDFTSNSINNFIENQLIMDLPRLDSPTNPSIKEAAVDQQQSGLIVTGHNNDHESGGNNNIKWEILDNLLGSEYLAEPTSSSFSNYHDYELDPHDQLGSFLECFPNL